MLDAGKPALTVPLAPEEQAHHRSRCSSSATSRPSSPATSRNPTWPPPTHNPYVQKVRRVRQHASGLRGGRHQRADRERPRRPLDPAEAEAFLKELGVRRAASARSIRATYHLLGLRTYFTAGEKEVRAWTIHAGDTAPKAAGVIHSDFERGFIKAETVAYDDLVALRLRRRGPREGTLPDGRQGIRRRRRRRDALQVQRVASVPSTDVASGLQTRRREHVHVAASRQIRLLPHLPPTDKSPEENALRCKVMQDREAVPGRRCARGSSGRAPWSLSPRRRCTGRSAQGRSPAM